MAVPAFASKYYEHRSLSEFAALLAIDSARLTCLARLGSAFDSAGRICKTSTLNGVLQTL